MKYNVSDEYFESNGYIYQKLFAGDIPYYHIIKGKLLEEAIRIYTEELEKLEKKFEKFKIVDDETGEPFTEYPYGRNDGNRGIGYDTNLLA